MKKILIFFTLLYSTLVFSESSNSFLDIKHYYHSDRSSILIQENYTEFKNDLGGEGELLTKLVESKITSDLFFNHLDTEDQKYILLNCICDEVSYISLIKTMENKRNYYEKWEIPYHLSLSDKFYSSPYLRGVEIMRASSFLKEKINGQEINYLPDRWDLFGIPWAINKYEKEKKITFITSHDNKKMDDKHPFLPISKLVIVNGLLVPDKEYLYEENCRAKTIRISYGKNSEVYILEDNTNFQILELLTSIKPVPTNEITLEIIDWYQGTKYNDIVITAVLFPNAKMK